MEKTVRVLPGELAEPPILVFPNWDAIEDRSLPLMLYYDASTDGIGTTLE